MGPEHAIPAAVTPAHGNITVFAPLAFTASLWPAGSGLRIMKGPAD